MDGWNNDDHVHQGSPVARRLAAHAVTELPALRARVRHSLAVGTRQAAGPHSPGCDFIVQDATFLKFQMGTSHLRNPEDSSTLFEILFWGAGQWPADAIKRLNQR
jgi:hypothetical protein